MLMGVKMPFFGKKRANSDFVDPPGNLKEFSDELKDQYLNIIQRLMLFLKKFVLDIEEINSDKFKSELDDFKNAYLDDNSSKQLSKLLNHQTPKIERYIDRQRIYLNDRENELRNIIDLLSKAMIGSNTDNKRFYRRLNDHSEKLEKITLLDDIKKIKNSLETEVFQIRRAINDQKKLELKKIEKLACQVDTLKTELEKTRTHLQTDSLTGINNRKALDQYLEQLIEQSLCYKIPFAMMLLDIDDFKKINDNYGHLIGDRVLVAFAQKCRSLIRSDDFIARYGGEEFVIILPKVSLRNAKKKAQQICKSLATTCYAIDEGGGDDSLAVTASIGVVSMRKEDSVTGIIKRADKALYRAKREGKNRVVTEKDI
jgi:diguanylate cyclase